MNDGFQPVNEVSRTIYFKNGNQLLLEEVLAIDKSGTWLKLLSDDGLFIVNPDDILFHHITLDDDTVVI